MVRNPDNNVDNILVMLCELLTGNVHHDVVHASTAAGGFLQDFLNDFVVFWKDIQRQGFVAVIDETNGLLHVRHGDDR